MAVVQRHPDKAGGDGEELHDGVSVTVVQGREGRAPSWSDPW